MVLLRGAVHGLASTAFRSVNCNSFYPTVQILLLAVGTSVANTAFDAVSGFTIYVYTRFFIVKEDGAHSRGFSLGFGILDM